MSARVRRSRRAFLRGAGGIALALPMLKWFAEPAAAAPGIPKRFILFFHPQGTILSHWALAGASESDFGLGEILSPLAAWKDRCLFVYGVDNKISKLNRSNGHNSSTRSCLTANVYSTALDAGGQLIPVDAQPDVEGHSSGPSIDQELAGRLQNGHPYKSIDLSANEGNGRLLYAGWEDPVTSEPDPQAAFDKLFAQSNGAAEELAKLRARRLSVLDAVKDNFEHLRARVGKEDKLTLDAHAEKVRGIETSIQNAKQCDVPVLAPPAGYDHQTFESASADLQLDLLHMAMACDLAPVGTFVFGKGHDPQFDGATVDGQPYSAGYDNWHAMVHEGRDLPDGGGGTYDSPGLIAGYRWYTEKFASLLERLASTPEGEGTMLDNSCVLWMSEFGNGAGHNNNKLHAVLAGNTGGTKPMGRRLELGSGGDWDASPHATNQLFVTLLNGFGFDDTTFGWQGDDVPAGPLPGIL